MARLRSHDKAMLRPEIQPLPQTRKRRASSTFDTTLQEPATDASTTMFQPRSIMKTPSKPKKKVRFSDPGPSSLSAAGSTGITPFIARTTLLPNTDISAPRYLKQPPRRRPSLPNISTTAASFELGSSLNPIEVHQFVPYRECLTPRVTRQLRRRNMSEELHTIEAEHKSEAKLRQEVQHLKDELALARQLGAGPGDDAAGTRRIEQLETEIDVLKAEAEASMATEEEGESVDLVLGGGGMNTSPSPTSYDDSAYGSQAPTPAPSSASAQTSALPSPTTSTASVQTNITSQSLTVLHSYAASQTKHLSHARLALEHLLPGETSLGLSPTNDASPLLDAMLSHLSGSKASLATSQAALAASQAQESNIRSKFNTSLRQLEEARGQHAKLLAEVQTGRQGEADALRRTISELEMQAAEQERSHGKLTEALEKYREDVRGLEKLVEELEVEHAGTVKRMREERAERESDLESIVAAETRGRREAERECDEGKLMLRVAGDKERELRAAMGEKQAVVRELEEEMDILKEGCEREVGGLNARVGELSAALTAAKRDAERAEVEVRRLVARVEQEREAGRQGVETLKADILRCAEEAESKGAKYATEAERRGEEAVRTGLGLLTPTVEGGRFRDVGVGAESLDGKVEMGRGRARKRKADSGFGILMEDGREE